MAIEFQETNNIPPNTNTEVFSFTNSSGGDIFMKGLGGQGNGRAEWFVFIDSILKAKRRNTAAFINVDLNMEGVTLQNSKEVSVTLTQYEKSNSDFSVEMRYLP